MVQWSSFITHILYTVVGGATIGYTIDNPGPLQASVVLLGFRGITGAIAALLDDNSDVQKVYEFADRVSSFAFPLYVTHLWLEAGLKKELAYIHPLLAIIPFCLHVSNSDDKDANSAVVLACAMSAGYITITRNNWFGLAATFVYAISHGVIRYHHSRENVSESDMHNLFLALYMALSARGILDA